VPAIADLPDFDVDFQPDFCTRTQADEIYPALLSEIPWEQHFVRMFGKQIAAPRRSSWHGDARANYRYSGVSYPPRPYTPALTQLLGQLQNLGLRFNSVLCNHYRHGQDSMGWHSDDEPELGQNPIIASLSFGAARRFCFRHTRLGLKYEMQLTHGSLLLMQGATQHAWQHALPKTSKRVLPAAAELADLADLFRGERAPDPGRINLTFRWINF
jgi:alkylated DNA repair dioxygenase AlkB